MRVSNEMIRKELRLLGKVYRRFIQGIPKKAVMPKIQRKVRYKKNIYSRTYNEYIRRPDESKLRLLIKKTSHNQKNGPVVLWIHGGGYSAGMPEMAYFSMARIAAKNCTIVSPDYRLSTEAPYPAAIEDCYQALLWIKRHINELNGRPDQIFVGGESAGGGLTAALSLYARDRGTVNIACQMPLYPMLDDRMQTPSMKNNDAPVWDEELNIQAWNRYLNGRDRQKTSKYAAPARETNYTNLPPTITFVGDIEPFYDETVEYVNNLEKANIPVAFKVFNGCYHAFDMIAPWTKVSKEAKQFFKEEFQKACTTYFAPQSSAR